MPEKDTTISRVSPYIREHFQAAERDEFIPGKSRIPLSVPTYGLEEVEEALESLLSTWVSMGKKVKQFEQMFANYLGSKYAIMVNSGSSANLLGLSVLTNVMVSDRLMPGDEIITPAVTWATTVYPIANVGCTPVFVDVDLETFNVLPEELEKAVSSKTKALMPVHLLGNPCEIDSLNKTAEAKGLYLVEDACESTGAEYLNTKVGTFGDMGTFSFYMSHHISTIEGGMVVTDDDQLSELLKAMRCFGWVRDLRESKKYAQDNPEIDSRFLFITSGFNFRPTELQGAFGMHQMGKLDSFIEHRRKNAQYWNKRLQTFQDTLILPEERPKTKHVYFGYPITLRPEAPVARESLTRYLESKGIETRPIMAGNITEQPVMKQIRSRTVSSLENSKLIMRRSFFFGNHNGIGPAEREYIGDCLVDFMSSVGRS